MFNYESLLQPACRQAGEDGEEVKNNFCIAATAMKVANGNQLIFKAENLSIRVFVSYIYVLFATQKNLSTYLGIFLNSLQIHINFNCVYKNINKMSIPKIIWFKILLITFFFTSCNNRKEPRFLGELSIPNIDNVFFKVYQEDKFDSVVGIYFEIVDKDDNVLSPMNLLIGTSDFDRSDAKDFYTGSHDSIIYLSFVDPNIMYAIYDLKTKKTCCSYTSDTLNVDRHLAERLKLYNQNLKPY